MRVGHLSDPCNHKDIALAGRSKPTVTAQEMCWGSDLMRTGLVTTNKSAKRVVEVCMIPLQYTLH